MAALIPEGKSEWNIFYHWFGVTDFLQASELQTLMYVKCWRYEAHLLTICCALCSLCAQVRLALMGGLLCAHVGARPRPVLAHVH